MSILREYCNACDTMATFRNEYKGKLIMNKTRMYRIEFDKIALRHHDTDIIIFQPNTIILNNGGWPSRTTKSRMNEFLVNWMVFQKNFDWYIEHIPTGLVIDYTHGIQLHDLPDIACKLVAMDRIY